MEEEEEEDHLRCDLHPMIAGQVSGACLHSHQEAMEAEGDVVQVGTSDRMARIGEDLLCQRMITTTSEEEEEEMGICSSVVVAVATGTIIAVEVVVDSGTIRISSGTLALDRCEEPQ